MNREYVWNRCGCGVSVTDPCSNDQLGTVTLRMQPIQNHMFGWAYTNVALCVGRNGNPDHGSCEPGYVSYGPHDSAAYFGPRPIVTRRTAGDIQCTGKLGKPD